MPTISSSTHEPALSEPLVPRLHLFELNDLSWNPPFLRRHFQNALTETWTTRVPLIQQDRPADVAAAILVEHLGPSLPSFTFVDFCAGGGGPTPAIERTVNAQLEHPVDFVLTDLHPNVEAWTEAAASSKARGGRLRFESRSVDAADAPAWLLGRDGSRFNGPVRRNGAGNAKIFRLYNLAFHHFDDVLARRILKNTLETSDGFAIFELQDRSLMSVVAVLALGIGVILVAPAYALRHGAPEALFFCWALPLLPFALVFDGLVSSLRTRTPAEVMQLMRTCKTDAPDWEDTWEMNSGSTWHLWPFGYVNWIVCKNTLKD